MNEVKQSILRSARISELKRNTMLVTPRPNIELPRDTKRQMARLRAMLVAERRRNAALVEQLR